MEVSAVKSQGHCGSCRSFSASLAVVFQLVHLAAQLSTSSRSPLAHPVIMVVLMAGLLGAFVFLGAVAGLATFFYAEEQYQHVRLSWLRWLLDWRCFHLFAHRCGPTYSFYMLYAQCFTEGPQPCRVHLVKWPTSSASSTCGSRALVCGYVLWAWIALTLFVAWCRGRWFLFGWPCTQVQGWGQLLDSWPH